MSNNSTLETMLDLAAFQMWQAEQNKAVEDSVLMKHRERLHKIIRRVIENELNEQDKLIIKLFWYDEFKVVEIAEILGLHHSFVRRHIKKSNAIIFKNLKYVIEYCNGLEF